MTTAPVAEVPNKVEITDAGPCRKKVKIEIPSETVDANLATSVETLLVEAEMPGFRKGRAPRRLVEKRFGGLLKSQTKEQLVSQAFSKAIEDNKVRVIGQPTSEQLGNVELQAGKPLVFEIDVEVLPTFNLPSLEGIAVRKPTIEVTDEMVQKEIDKFCLQEGTLEERQAPEGGDYITGHAKLTGPNGKVFFESDGIVVRMPGAEDAGKGMIVGLAVDDLGKQLGKPKIGEKITVKTRGPESHENEEMRNVDLVVEYTPSRIDRIIPADANELCGRFGLADLDALKNVFRQRLQQRVLIEQMSVMRQQIAKYLLEKTEMPLPERMTAQQAGRNLQRHRMELKYRGISDLDVEQRIASLRNLSGAEAVRDLKLFFIMDKAGEDLAVRVTEGEVNSRIAQIAQERSVRPEKLRAQLEQSGELNSIYLQVREHKVMDAILAKATVTELSADEFQKQLAAENKAIAEASKAKKG